MNHGYTAPEGVGVKILDFGGVGGGGGWGVPITFQGSIYRQTGREDP